MAGRPDCEGMRSDQYSLDNVAASGERGPRIWGDYSMKALRTLVVEEDAMIGGLLAETLENFGYTVCAVESNVANAAAAASHRRRIR